MAGTEGKHYMNKRHGEHMGNHEAAIEPKGKEKSAKGGGHHPHIHIHSHSGGHTVHVMHPDGRHEAHEHAKGDADGIAQHVHDNLGGQPSAGAPDGLGGGDDGGEDLLAGLSQ